MTISLGNGQDVRSLSDVDFGDYLDKVSRGDVFSEQSRLLEMFKEARQRGIHMRTYGPLNSTYQNALLRFNDSGLRCELIQHQWYRLTPEERTFLVEKGNTPERLKIAQEFVLDLDTSQFKALLVGPEAQVALAAYENGFPSQVRESFERLGLVDPTKTSFTNVAESDFSDVTACRTLPLGTLDMEDVNPAIARMVQGVVARQVARDLASDSSVAK